MQTVMTHQFSRVPQAEIQRSSFDRSHGHKTTFDAGYLIPVYIDEALPGDTFNMNMSAFARIATPLKPPMDNLFMDSFFFSVPIRLIWSNWERFNGAQDEPEDSTDFYVPQMTAPAVMGVQNGELSDYFGIPTDVGSIVFNSLWHRAYNLIWNEWFRDQNIQDSVNVDKGDGPDNYANYTLLRRGKRHDYFTSCLPWPQKGPDVDLPLGTSAPVFGDDGYGMELRAVSGGSGKMGYSSVVPDHLNVNNQTGDWTSGSNVNIVPSGTSHVFADLSTATAATINALREAFQLQKLYERDARGGTRYTEILKAHFGVTSPDARLQRPEYLGGGTSLVLFHPVAQTSEENTTPQGNLAAFGTASFSGHGFSKSFTEHCVLIGLVSVRADLTYQHGINRMFTRRTRFDFYWPSLSHLGEQEVLNREIYMSGTADDLLVFGYQERFAEYRYKPSLVTGQFRSNFGASLDLWHLSQNFLALPTLSPEFIQEDPPVARIIAVPSEPQFLFDSYFRLKCARPMPVYGVPGLIDHF